MRRDRFDDSPKGIIVEVEKAITPSGSFESPSSPTNITHLRNTVVFCSDLFLYGFKTTEASNPGCAVYTTVQFVAHRSCIDHASSFIRRLPRCRFFVGTGVIRDQKNAQMPVKMAGASTSMDLTAQTAIDHPS
jgi:hypothetical protein